MKLAGKIAIVTGGGAGIGRIYAQALAREGAAVVIADIDTVAGARVAGEITRAGGRALALPVDMGNEATIGRMVAAAVEHFGGVDILVNNAARHLKEYAVGPVTLGVAKWRDMLEVNVTGPLIAAAACRPSMSARGGGVIINQSSIGAYSASTAYGISKLALNGLTVALARELAPDNIRVNGIAPGMVDSESALATYDEETWATRINQQLIKRRGRMTDLVSTLLFLVSDDSSFITGQTLIVDGGSTVRL